MGYEMKPGIYEQVINKLIQDSLDKNEFITNIDKIDAEESFKVLGFYVFQILEKALKLVKENDKSIENRIDLCNKIINQMQKYLGDDSFSEYLIDKKGELLLSLSKKLNNIKNFDEKVEEIRPVSSVSRTSMFTGATHEPTMISEIRREILSADRIDFIVSFIKFSGLRLLLKELNQFTYKGKLRIITTSYMGATDPKAIEELRKLPNTEVKVSYDTKRTRLHAKAYIFHRDSGHTTAYVGSSNMSNVAMSEGLEWNVKLTAMDMKENIDKISATFEGYWNDKDFVSYNEGDEEKLQLAIDYERKGKAEYEIDININPYPYQQEILDKLESERIIRNSWKNLIVAATGTGKTMIAAFDYKKFVKNNKSRENKVLFIAHREEILNQSIKTFQHVLKDHNFGEVFVGTHKPKDLKHLFMSIQTFNSREFDTKVDPDYYDYIVVDEFHHAKAKTYQKLLTYFKPKILLGLTATPERMDGKDVTEYFDGRIAADIRLPEAIDRKLLCPFHYFGITDTVDLSDVKWKRGGYDVERLTEKYITDNGIRAQMVLDNVIRYSTNMDDIKGLGFCVSVEHAKYMENFFNKKGLKAIHLSGETKSELRKETKDLLASGEIKFIFVVDLYNEGIDIPEINTVLFLRPTESLTVFLQQLGRGLRLSDHKDCLTVLDFVGQANEKYDFESKFQALLSVTKNSIEKEIKTGFMNLPKGCFITLEKKAQEYVLNNIEKAISKKSGLINRIKSFEEDSGKELSLKNFIEYYHLSLEKIYTKDSFSRLCVAASIKDDFKDADEEVLTRSLPRLCKIDSVKWIKFIIEMLKGVKVKSKFNQEEEKMILMLNYTIWLKTFNETGFKNLIDVIEKIKKNKTLCNEIIELLEIRFNEIDFVDSKIELGFDHALYLHCNYSRDQILAGLGEHTANRKVPSREGIYFIKDKKLDVFFITLNKSEKDYSPTTMYNDYAVSESTFHWQSQSGTSNESSVGKRYISGSSKVVLFVREYKSQQYTFLGTAKYISCEGSKPISIIYKLDHDIPAKYLKQTTKAV